MTAHVAEASELSGRVVLWLDPQTTCRPEALDAPVRLAAAYGAEVETVFISPRTHDVGDTLVPLRRVRVGSGGESDEPDLRSELVQRHFQRVVEDAAHARKVIVRHAERRGDALDGISEMCLARGPWNIVALPRLPPFDGYALMNAMLANISGATGFLICGGSPSKAATNRIVVFAEDGERLPSMLRAAERMAGEKGTIHLFIAAETRMQYEELEAQARLLAAESYVIFEPTMPTLGVGSTLVEPTARLKPSLIIAPYGGAAIANGKELATLATLADAPILIVR